MNRVIKKFRIVFLLIILVLILALVFFLPTFSSVDNVLSVSYLSEDKLHVSNLLPMTDVVGMKINADSNKVGVTGYLEFEVSSSIDRKVEYEIYLTKNDFELEVPPKFVKVYLTDENDVLIESVKSSKIPTYFDLKVSDINPSGRVLYSGNLKNKGSKKFKLRMWVADTYELTVDARNFSVNLNVKEK